MKAKILNTIFLMLFFLTTVRATHIMGGEITYKFISGNTYEVTLKMYRDCNGIPLTAPWLFVRSSVTADSSLMQLASIKDITGIPASCSTKSRCTGSYQYGIEEHLFVDTVTLPTDTACWYRLSVSQSSRSSGITTTATSMSFYIEALLNKCLTAKNSSPVFNSQPRHILSVGKDVTYAYNAVDSIDGDIVTYELAPPLEGLGVQLAYNGNFSYLRPVTFLGFPNTTLSCPAGFHLDTAGNLSFRPNKQNEMTPIDVKVSEWRNIGGVLTKISEITREVVYIVSPSSSNSSPTVSCNTSSYQNCSSGTACWNINISDPNMTDSLTLDYSHSLRNITFTRTGTKSNATIKVCYTPDPADTSQGKLRKFTISATDSACTIPGSVSKTFFFIMGEQMPDSFKISDSLNCKKLTLDVKKGNVTGAFNYLWNIHRSSGSTDAYIGQAQSITFADTGWQKIQLTISSAYYCDTLHYFDSVYIKPPLNVNLLNPTLLCETDAPVTLNASPTGGSWSGSNVSGGIFTPSTTAKGDNNVTYNYMDGSTGCSYTKTGNIHVVTNPVINNFTASPAYGNKPLSTVFTSSVTSDTTVSYLWDFDDPASGPNDSSILANPSHTYNDTGRYTVSLTVSNGVCPAKTFSRFKYIVVLLKGLGIPDDSKTGISIYPNPASNFVRIEADETIGSVSIFDLSGKKVLEKEINSIHADIDISGLTGGVYLVKAKTGEKIFIEKLFIKK